MHATEPDIAAIGVQRRILTVPLDSVLEDVLARAVLLVDADGARLDDAQGDPWFSYGTVTPVVHSLSAPVMTLHSAAGSLVVVRTSDQPFEPCLNDQVVLLAELAAAALLASEAAARDALAAVRAETLAAMHGSSGQLRALFGSSPLGVALVRSSDLALLRTNDALSGLTGVPGRALSTMTVSELVPPTERDEFCSWLRNIPDNVRGASRELRLLAPDGEPIWTRVFAAWVYGAVPEQLVVQFEDITSQWRAQQLLSRLAHTDPLTGLANRLQVVRQLDSALSRAGNEAVGLLYVDLDGFKNVNDTLGHSAGDELLLEMADRLSASVRPRDVVGRIGGDEFVVIVDHLVDLAELERMTERIRSAVLEEVELTTGEHVRVTASIGLSTARPGESPAELISRADERMYAEKRHRRQLRNAILEPRQPLD
jgi:diguanylate cyclase (GGDEF)-like protein/PAS domain S-box-containing protein